MQVLRKVLIKVVTTVLVLFGVSILSFMLVRIAPGDPALMLAGETATEETLEAIREKMGLNDSYIVQYTKYITGVLKGDLGYSYFYNQPCLDIILGRLPATAKLSAVAMCITIVVALPLGLVAGVKKGSVIDTISMFVALLGQALSPVWLGLLLILIFGVGLQWLPTQGMATWKHIIMPAFCLGFPFSALVTRMLRSGMVDVLQEDYITATRARGISKVKVYTKYAFKNALLPIITVMGSQIGTMLAGSIVIETIFGWPGIGDLTIKAINMRDFQLVQSILLFAAFIFTICILLIDVLYSLVDKRITFD